MVAKRIGLFLAGLHLLLFVGFLLWVRSTSSQDGQSELLWLLWIPIDFPWSLVVPLLSPAAGDNLISPTTPGIRGVLYYLPHFVHGIVGTIWWYFLPSLVGLVYSKLTSRK